MMMDVAATIAEILDGNRDAFRDIVAEFGPGVRAFFASHIAGDPDTVDELSQEAFIAAFEGLPDFRPDADFGLWLKGIARNKLLYHLRQAYSERGALEKLRAQAAAEASAEVMRLSADDGTERIERLRECLEKLHARAREIITARYYEGEKVNDIAKRLKTSVTAVSSLLFRGRKELETCIEKG